MYTSVVDRHAALLEEDLELLATPGGDSSADSVVPPGLLVGCGGGRRKEGFFPGIRGFLRDFGRTIPRVGSAGELLEDGGERLLDLLRTVAELLLQDMRGKLLAYNE